VTRDELIECLHEAVAIVDEAFPNRDYQPEVRVVAFDRVLGELLAGRVEAP
jgi:hypothetical protein